jgi:hypothetical protein
MVSFGGKYFKKAVSVQSVFYSPKKDLMSMKSALSDTESETIPHLDLQEMLVLLHLAGYPDDNEGIVQHPGTGDRHDDANVMKAIEDLNRFQKRDDEREPIKCFFSCDRRLERNKKCCIMAS